jgi:phosphoribosyl 1,2-cyclic phosphate phosphodiesterase
MPIKLTFLGTGTSVGVPQIGCTCKVCKSDDPRDKRNRSGIYVQSDKVAFLVDMPPEFRIACLKYNIIKVDALVFTHAHMDHIAAFDDIRRFNTLNQGSPMRCYAAEETINSIKQIFPYISDKKNELGLYRPMINYCPVSEPFMIGDVKLTPLPVEHGPRTNGYRMDLDGSSIAYIPDCAEIPESTLEILTNLDILIIDCLREREHPTHLNIEDMLSYMDRLKPKRGYITHICHDISHAEYEQKLPQFIRPAYDGLEITA